MERSTLSRHFPTFVAGSFRLHRLIRAMCRVGLRLCPGVTMVLVLAMCCELVWILAVPDPTARVMVPAAIVMQTQVGFSQKKKRRRHGRGATVSAWRRRRVGSGRCAAARLWVGESATSTRRTSRQSCSDSSSRKSRSNRSMSSVVSSQTRGFPESGFSSSRAPCAFANQNVATFGASTRSILDPTGPMMIVAIVEPGTTCRE
jgi:hypothetical protein